MALVAVLLAAGLVRGEHMRVLGYGSLFGGIALILRHRIIPPHLAPLVPLALMLGVLGWFFDLYGRFGLYDIFLHTMIPGACAFLAGSALFPDRMRPMPAWAAAAVAAAVGLALAGLWEIAEWLADVVLSAYATEFTDTMTDLAAGAIGSALGAVLWIATPRATSSEHRNVPIRETDPRQSSA